MLSSLSYTAQARHGCGGRAGARARACTGGVGRVGTCRNRQGSRLQDGFLRFWTAISNEFKAKGSERTIRAVSGEQGVEGVADGASKRGDVGGSEALKLPSLQWTFHSPFEDTQRLHHSSRVPSFLQGHNHLKSLTIRIERRMIRISWAMSC